MARPDTYLEDNLDDDCSIKSFTLCLVDDDECSVSVFDDSSPLFDEDFDDSSVSSFEDEEYYEDEAAASDDISRSTRTEIETGFAPKSTTRALSMEEKEWKPLLARQRALQQATLRERRRGGRKPTKGSKQQPVKTSRRLVAE
eukprot:CAMPEP_0113639698 /NCGR_PEP_ID=MMETSP0017_2-20120614/20832_1 /TAXON_ID=2856 /ORGANISM="Cylindrotheca closterium" /LENGTH=142 /DNA_ID=CAMNT_0000550937 /DNA_START=80 /DNA_END=508 /DNA_ORIENTATION=- /assembly_acc=CAM_ASM_000147